MPKETEKEKFASFQKEREQQAKTAKVENWLRILKAKRVTVIEAVNDTAARHTFNIALDHLKSTGYKTEYIDSGDLFLIKDCRTNKYFLEISESVFIRAYEKIIIFKSL